MNEIKYVIIIPRGMNIHGARAIIFNGMLNHADIAEATIKREAGKVHSAGFCNLTKGKVKRIYGTSTSLGLGPQPGDEAVIERTREGRHSAFDLMAFG